ncbi:related to Spo11-Coprinopsis cinerea [Serendipita indica DSM 11827]|uniref:Related to Spo11-Coprinopsis cinerea n=1 Tax=Serendipita indica (strain DSM 11827) TaxID=1109443 RepID=G4T754_SERID|nr:related to Spo11-Coprinopsis cinerea [Serendipita indica DSM 11827]
MIDASEDEYEEGLLEELSSSPMFEGFRDDADSDAFLEFMDSNSEQEPSDILEFDQQVDENAWQDEGEGLDVLPEYTPTTDIIDLTQEDEVTDPEALEFGSEPEEELDEKTILLQNIQDLILATVKQIANCAEGKLDRIVIELAVDDLAATFGVERSALLVRASSKGIFCGSVLSIRLVNGTVIQGNDDQATLTPAGEDVEELVVEEDIGWVLVVEKEAIFQTLCQAEFTRINALRKPGIILTGKGYPDIASRQLLHKLSSGLPETVPIFALVDADPHGIEILSVYAFGSISMRHQNDGLTAERVVWIGVMLTELERRGVAAGDMLGLNQRDRKKLESLLRREDRVMPQLWKNELRFMLERGQKAEIEAVYSGGLQDGRQPLLSYVEEEMQSYFVAQM